VFGVVTGRSDHTIEGRGKVVGCKFRPGGFHPFVPVPAASLTDRAVALEETFGEPGDLHERVIAARLDRAQVAVVEAFLRARMPERDPHVETVGWIIRTILTTPDLTRVDQLVGRTGMSSRSLQRLFREYVGVTPEVGAPARCACTRRPSGSPRTGRRRRSRSTSATSTRPIIKDFKSVVGRSPAEYAAMCSGPRWPPEKLRVAHRLPGPRRR
jgi:AraC-like DNA-binding protein